MRYRLRTLLIVLGVAPPLIALAWWYGRTALGLLLLALLFYPDILVFAAQGIAWIVGRLWSKSGEGDGPT